MHINIYIYIYDYNITWLYTNPIQKSWDTVQIVNKKGMQ